MKVLILLLMFLASCATSADREVGSALAITNVTLLDGRGGPGRPDVAVLVENGKITRVVDAQTRFPSGTQRIDGRGGYLLPGFIDMHAHLLAPRCTPPAGSSSPFDRPVSERMLGVLLDFGITTIRSPGNPTREGLALRDDLNAGAVRGPRARASAEIINDPDWTEVQLREYVRDALPFRPDYFKVYAGLPPASVAVVVREAHKAKIPVIGHMQRTSWVEAVGIGVDHLTHGVDWSPSTLRPERRAAYAAALKERGGIRARIDWLELLDPTSPEVARMLDTVASAGLSVDPTLVAYDSKFRDPSSDRYRRNASVNVVPELHDDWRACMTITRGWTPQDYRRWAAAWPNMLGLIREMHRRGVLMTTGTDITNPWVIPGESLHQEFELLNEAGIAPLEILRMTGENAARAIGLSDVGVVEAGRRADLVLLSRDPRQDIRNTRSIRWVMQGGRLVARESVQ